MKLVAAVSMGNASAGSPVNSIGIGVSMVPAPGVSFADSTPTGYPHKHLVVYSVTILSHTTEQMCGTIGARLSVVDAFSRVAGPGCPAGLLCEGAAPGDHSASSSRQLLRTRSAHWRTFCPDGSIQAAKCSARRSGLDLPYNRSVGSYAPDPPAFSGHPGQHIKKGI